MMVMTISHGGEERTFARVVEERGGQEEVV